MEVESWGDENGVFKSSGKVYVEDKEDASNKVKEEKEKVFATSLFEKNGKDEDDEELEEDKEDEDDEEESENVMHSIIFEKDVAVFVADGYEIISVEPIGGLVLGKKEANYQKEADHGQEKAKDQEKTVYGQEAKV